MERIIIEEPTNSEISDGVSDYSGEPNQELEQEYSESEQDFNQNSLSILENTIVDHSTRIFQIASHFYKKMSLPGNKENCKSCKTYHKSRKLSVYGKHLVAGHTERVFQHQRLEHVTPEQFTNCCKYILNLHINSAPRLQGEERSCPFCSSKANGITKLRMHLVTMHFNTLEKEIMDLQENNDSEKLSKLQLPVTRTQPFIQCTNWEEIKNDCKKLFQLDSKLKRYKCSLCRYLAPLCNPQGHLLNEHPETLFENCKPGTFTPEEFHALCVNILNEEVSKCKWVRAVNKSKAFECHICSLKIFTRNNVRYHLASRHYNMLVENLVKNQNNNLLKTVQIITYSHGHLRSRSNSKKNLFTIRRNMSTEQQKLANVINQNVIQKGDDSDQAECRICHTSWNQPRSKANRRIRKHFVLNHAEQLFDQTKLAHVTTEDFKFYCKHALSVEMSYSKLVKQDVGEHSIICKYCDFKSKHDDFRYHIAIKHYKIMEGKITTLQEEGNIDSLRKTELPKIRETQEKSNCKNWNRLNLTCKTSFILVPDKPGKLQCLLCKQLAQAANPRMHLVAHHPETLFENSKPRANLTPEKFRVLCKNILYGESNLSQRIAGNTKTTRCYKCHLCKLKTHHTMFLRYHIASKHFTILQEKLLKMNDEEIQLQLEQGRVSKPVKRTRSTKDALGNKLLQRYCNVWKNKVKCTICKGEFPETVTVLEHFVDVHLDSVFAEMKLNEVTNQQFKICCTQLMGKEASSRIGKSLYKCQHCKAVNIETQKELRYHLVNQHFTIMEEALVRLQTNQVWKRKGERDCEKASESFTKRRKIENAVERGSPEAGKTENLKDKCNVNEEDFERIGEDTSQNNCNADTSLKNGETNFKGDFDIEKISGVEEEMLHTSEIARETFGVYKVEGLEPGVDDETA